MTDRYKELPPLVNHWLNTHDCYLVGSGAVWLAGGDAEPNDYDMIACEPEHFNRMLRSLPENAKTEAAMINTMGGVKVTLPSGDEIDVWPHSLNEYFQQMARKNYERCVAVRLDPCIVVRSQDL